MYIPKIPNNSLTKEIKKIVDLCEELDEDYTSTFSEAASEEEMTKWEKENRTTIPESYKEWLRFSRDCDIMQGFARLYMPGEHEKGLPEDYIDIGMLIGDGEFLCFSKSTGKFMRFFEGEVTTIESFKDFLIYIIEELNDELNDTCSFSPEIINILNEAINKNNNDGE